MSRNSEVGVLLVIRTLSGGGAELVVETLARGVERGRFDVMVCELVGSGEKAADLLASGYEVISLVPDGDVRESYVNFLRLRRLVTRRGIDVLHTHCASALADAALCRCLAPRTRLVHTFHFGDYPHVPRQTARLERTFIRFANQLVAVGEGQARAIRDTYGTAVSGLRTIRNGVGVSASRVDETRMSEYRRDGRLLVGMIGTLFEQKGHSDMLEVAQALKSRAVPVRFLIVGGGPLRGELEEARRSKGLEEVVEFLGWVKDASSTILPAVDIFFQPSRWEAMSMVLLEAAVAGKPIVCTDVGEAPMILAEGESALFTGVGDVSGMAAAIERLVADPSLRERLGRAARVVVEMEHTAAAMIRRYEALYLELANRA